MVFQNLVCIFNILNWKGCCIGGWWWNSRLTVLAMFLLNESLRFFRQSHAKSICAFNGRTLFLLSSFRCGCVRTDRAMICFSRWRRCALFRRPDCFRLVLRRFCASRHIGLGKCGCWKLYVQTVTVRRERRLPKGLLRRRRCGRWCDKIGRAFSHSLILL